MTIKTDNTQVIENLKCCGNCRYLVDICFKENECELKGQDIDSYMYCKDWEFDGLTREDRE